jgi:hypothetical protein
MIELKHILCPTDLSTGLDPALRYALALTHAYEAQLTLCYRPNDGEVSAGLGAIQGMSSTEALAPVWNKQIFDTALLRFLQPEGLSELNWQGLVIQGEDVGEAIAHTASELAEDLTARRSWDRRLNQYVAPPLARFWSRILTSANGCNP